jgi:hypothetical protein
MMEVESNIDQFYMAYNGDDYSKAVELLHEVLLKEGGSAWLYSQAQSTDIAGIILIIPAT